jgi:hypothetical protein
LFCCVAALINMHLWAQIVGLLASAFVLWRIGHSRRRCLAAITTLLAKVGRNEDLQAVSRTGEVEERAEPSVNRDADRRVDIAKEEHVASAGTGGSKA